MVESFTYSWEDMETDDPAFKDGKPPVGSHIKIICDEEEVKEVTKCKTGTDGFVEFLTVINTDGMTVRFETEQDGTPKRRVVYGEVLVEGIYDELS